MSADEVTYLASLRPSRIREVQRGALGWAHVTLIDIDSGTGDGLRAGLELFGLQVRRVRVGQARHLVAALHRPAGEFVVLAGHGDDGRLLVPELAGELERFQPVHGPWGPDEIRRFACLAGTTVIATGCDTGRPELAEAFLDVGASAYVAPLGAPFGYASFFAPLFLFYELVEDRTLAHAVARLQAHDPELARWRLFTR